MQPYATLCNNNKMERKKKKKSEIESARKREFCHSNRKSETRKDEKSISVEEIEMFLARSFLFFLPHC